MFDQLFNRIASTLHTYWVKHESNTTFSNTDVSNKRPPNKIIKKRYRIVKNLLGIFPVILLITFCISFYWDFDNITLNVFNGIQSLEGLLRIVSVSGLIGYATNWLAITMLFKPVTKRPLLGQGLVPRQKDRIAVRLADTISRELLSPSHIKAYIAKSEILTRLKQTLLQRTQDISKDQDFRSEIKNHIHEFVQQLFSDEHFKRSVANLLEEHIHKKIQGDSLNKLALKTYTLIKGAELNELLIQSLEQIPHDIGTHLEHTDQFYEQLPVIVSDQIDGLEQKILFWIHSIIHQLDIYTYIKDHLESYDESQIEALIRNSTNEELRYIQQLGAVIGFIGGCIIWQPLFSIVSISFLILCFYVADQALHQLNNKYL